MKQRTNKGWTLRGYSVSHEPSANLSSWAAPKSKVRGQKIVGTGHQNWGLDLSSLTEASDGEGHQHPAPTTKRLVASLKQPSELPFQTKPNQIKT